MSAEQQSCRLCLDAVKNEFVEIDEIIKEMFDILLLKLDLDITSDPIICQDCMNVAKKCLNFKYTCISAEQIILSYIADRKEIKCNIKVIYEQEKRGCTLFDEDFKICQFCMTQLEKNNIVSLDTFMNESMLEMFSEYMPEMDIDNIENPLICTNCRENLYGYFKFVLNCLDLEENLKAYCKGNGTGSMGYVKFGNILQFMFTDILEYPDRCFETYKPCPQTSDPKQKNNINREIAIHNNIFDPQRSTSIDKGVSKIKKHKRSFCGYDSKKKSNAKDMLPDKDVSEIKMYKCLTCSYEAKRKRDLIKHMSSHKKSKLNVYKCSLCFYENKYRSKFERHMLIHKDVSLKCSLCGYEATRKCDLTKHMPNHKKSNLKMYKCSLCAIEFKHKSKFETHMLIHKDVSEIEMFKCSLCAYEAKRISALNVHMLVHKEVSEIEMHKCSVCAYEGKQRSHLTTHMLIHKDVSEIKMYNCFMCGFKSKYKSSLKKHNIIFHEDGSKKCSIKYEIP